MATSLKKIILTLLIAGMNVNGLTAVFGTYAYFSDAQVSTGNAFNAATLDFAAEHSWSYDPDSTCDPQTEICPGWRLTDTVSLATAGTLDFQYTISIVNAAETASSTMPLCDYLTVNGLSLKSFVSAPVQYSTSSVQALVFSLTGNDAALQDQTCNFDYLIQGWQTDFAGYGQGFFVKKIIGSSITSDPWMVEAPAVESETGNEGEAEGEGGEGGETGDESAGAPESEGGDIGDAADGDGQIQEQGEENQESEGDAGAEDGGDEGNLAGNDDSGGNADGGDQNAGTDGGGQAEGEAAGESAGGREQQGSTAGGVDMGQAAAGGNENTGGGDGGNAGGDGGAESGDGGQGSGDTGGGIGGGDGGAGGDAGGGGESGAE